MQDALEATRLFVEALKRNPEIVVRTLNKILLEDGVGIELKVLHEHNPREEEARCAKVHTVRREEDSRGG